MAPDGGSTWSSSWSLATLQHTEHGASTTVGEDDGIDQSSTWPGSLMRLCGLSVRPDIARMMEERSARTREMGACALLLVRLLYAAFFYINYVAEDPCDLGHFTANCASAFFHLLAFLFNLLVQHCERLRHLRRGVELAYVSALVIESILFAANNPLVMDAESRPLEALTVWSWTERPYFCRQLNLDRGVLLDAYLFNSVLALYILFVLRSGSSNVVVFVCFTLYTVIITTLGRRPAGDSYLNYVLVICNLGMMLAGKSMVEHMQVKVLMELNKEGQKAIEQKVLRCKAEQKLCRAEQATEPQVTASVVSSSNDTVVFTEEELVALKERGREEHWLVSAENLELIVDEVLGTGCYGKTVVGELVGTPCAVKLPKSIDSTKGVDALMEELCVLRHIRHPNIVTFHGACLDLASHPLAIVMEMVDRTDLLQYIAEQQSLLPTKQLWADSRSDSCCKLQECHILVCICRALRYLHACRPQVIHGDLKPSSISVEATPGLPVVKLLDFGLPCVMKGRNDPFGGAVRWAAPEVIMSALSREISTDTVITTAVDVFSLGRITYLLVSGAVPLSHLNAQNLKEATIRHAMDGKRFKLEWPADKHMIELKQLANQCMSHDPQHRPDMGTLHKQVERFASNLARRQVTAYSL